MASILSAQQQDEQSRRTLSQRTRNAAKVYETLEACFARLADERLARPDVDDEGDADGLQPTA